jgi:hypothetical protein
MREGIIVNASQIPRYFQKSAEAILTFSRFAR